MKIPAIRAKMGDWTYYVTTLTFQQVNDFVSRVDDELHKSDSLKELIQRSITNNYQSIKSYIINQPEMFFNAIVLAVYDDYPDWEEIQVKYGADETYQLGLLDFPSTHKIFPIDGQHRVEGIKSALIEKPELHNNKISAIFVGHKNDEEGLKRTRRLFSTLNRYAKPVTMDDIIALDEDDSVAIATRELLETHPLFTGRKVTKSKNKAIHNDDKDSFTSIINLYNCNWQLLKLFKRRIKLSQPDPIRDKKSIGEYLKFRPTESELVLFKEQCESFWNELVSSFSYIDKFTKTTTQHPALEFRNNEDGGNLLFRPVGLHPFVQAVLEIHNRSNSQFSEIFNRFSTMNFTLSNRPWRQVLWNDFEKVMIMGNQGLTKLLLIYLYDKTLLRPSEVNNLVKRYAAAINYNGENIYDVLEDIE